MNHAHLPNTVPTDKFYTRLSFTKARKKKTILKKYQGQTKILCLKKSNLTETHFDQYYFDWLFDD